MPKIISKDELTKRLKHGASIKHADNPQLAEAVGELKKITTHMSEKGYQNGKEADSSTDKMLKTCCECISQLAVSVELLTKNNEQMSEAIMSVCADLSSQKNVEMKVTRDGVSGAITGVTSVISKIH